MKYIEPGSLAKTIDAVNEAFFAGREISKNERRNIAGWIAGRQGLKGSYQGMFAPTESDFRDGIRLFTGEKVKTGAATSHILGEEACRSLLLLDIRDEAVRIALETATGNFRKVLNQCETEEWRPAGIYCCGTCTPALWRHLAAGGMEDQERRLSSGVSELKKKRKGDGQWQSYPFYWTLLALSEIDLPEAHSELEYAAPRLERIIRRKVRYDLYDQRRRALMERVLAKV